MPGCVCWSYSRCPTRLSKNFDFLSFFSPPVASPHRCCRAFWFCRRVWVHRPLALSPLLFLCNVVGLFGVCSSLVVCRACWLCVFLASGVLSCVGSFCVGKRIGAATCSLLVVLIARRKQMFYKTIQKIVVRSIFFVAAVPG